MMLLPAFTSTPDLNKVYNCDALTLLKAMPSNSVDCCVTSPPYFGLRDYGVPGQIGHEKTPAEYVQTLVVLFRELRRVLKDTGTFWLNLGDSYVGATSEYSSTDSHGSNSIIAKGTHASVAKGGRGARNRVLYENGLPMKSLLLIPHRVAIALQDDGWICRQDNVWAKPNPMPESVTDRTTRAHEYVFQFVKSGRYYFDKNAIAEPVKHDSIKRQRRAVSDNHKNTNGAPGQTPHSMFRARPNKQDELGKQTYAGFNERYEGQENPVANKRSVWTIAPAQFRESHFATFPTEIPEICIKAGCPPGGVVLDMFMGSGTTADVARRLSRQYIGCELNINYLEDIITPRLSVPYTPNLFIMQQIEIAI